MRKFLLGLCAVVLIAAGVSFAQSPGQIRLSSLAGPLGIAAQTTGPQSSYIPVNGGTFTCNGTSTVTVSNTNVDAGSLVLITLKTVGGTVGAVPAIQTMTVSAGFTLKCTASDTSIYNYAIFG